MSQVSQGVSNETGDLPPTLKLCMNGREDHLHSTRVMAGVAASGGAAAAAAQIDDKQHRIIASAGEAQVSRSSMYEQVDPSTHTRQVREELGSKFKDASFRTGSCGDIVATTWLTKRRRLLSIIQQMAMSTPRELQRGSEVFCSSMYNYCQLAAGREAIHPRDR